MLPAVKPIAELQLDTLRRLLDDADQAAAWLRPLGVVDVRRGHGDLVRIAQAGMPLDLLALVCGQLADELPRLSDADMALNNLERFISAARSPLALGSLFERDRQALPILLQILSTSQHLSELLIIDPEAYDLLRMTEGQPVARDVLVEELAAEVMALSEPKMVMTALRRFKRRETLRIAYGDLIANQPLEMVTEQISYLADALVESAVRFARRRLEEQRGVPRAPGGRRARFVVLALGKLGGLELNYSSDIDLVFVYDHDGSTDGKRKQTNVEFFSALARDTVKLLADQTDLGTAYRVDMRLRPEGQHGPLVTSLESTLHYYDVLGRTWERQAMVKARPIAGDRDLGQELLEQLEPWIYRRYLSRADISGIKALKRRIEQRAVREGAEQRDVKTGRGGLRDIEFAIQFLQLLNGGDLPELRTGNTLTAMDRLERVGCLSHKERMILEENYRFLRKLEHRLQIMFDLQTHLLPEGKEALHKLAIRMGVAPHGVGEPLPVFQRQIKTNTELNRKILDHLLHDAFRDDSQAEPEVDLVLDPDPPPQFMHAVLGRYGFADVPAAYANLMALSAEKIRFLSTRRCRHFLASIAPRLLEAIADTPDPDSTLVNLAKVSDSLGGKGVLWELFSFNPPTLRLYVNLCAYSPFLSEILTSNPGMIDELLDSLLLDRLPSLDWLDASLAELCRGAEDLDPILHSFKHAMQLRVGVRDILGKDDIRQTTAALSDIAQVCLKQIALGEQAALEKKFGRPTIGKKPRVGEACELLIVGLGKFGAREPNYHSDLDLIFLYEADGVTQTVRRSGSENQTTNQHFFGELGQRIIKVATRLGPYGRLYEIDPRLRPTGRSGALTTSLEELQRYFESGEGQLWERLALVKSRVVFGSPRAAARAIDVICDIAYAPKWQPDHARQIREMRLRMQETASDRNLKRGSGGIVDIEFIAQALQLKHQGQPAAIRAPGTLEALAALHAAGFLSRDDAAFLSEAYRFLRNVEARLRLMNTAARHDLPDNEAERVKLARLLGYSRAAALLDDCRNYTAEVRRRFDRLLE